MDSNSTSRKQKIQAAASLAPPTLNRCVELRVRPALCTPYVAETYDKTRYGQPQKVLGEGTYGLVLATDRNFALKCSKYKVGVMMQEDLRESAILRNLIHPNIVRVEQVVLAKQKVHARCGSSVIVMPQYDGTLRDKMVTGEFLGYPRLRAHFLYQLVRGIAFCHSRGVWHRDLKPENCLIDTDGSVPVLPTKKSGVPHRLVITDFGLAQGLAFPRSDQSREVQTLYYRAPEVLLGCTRYSAKIDVWSIGIIWLRMLLPDPKVSCVKNDDEQQLQCFFDRFASPAQKNDLKKWLAQFSSKKIERLSNNQFDLEERISQAQSQLKISSLEKRLLLRMLEIMPEKRISAAEALRDPYFDSVRVQIEAAQPASAISVLDCDRALFQMELAPVLQVESQPQSTWLGSFLYKEEPKVAPSLFATKHPDLHPNMMHVLTGWLLDVTVQLKKSWNTLALGIAFMYRYFDQAKKPVDRTTLQGYGTICWMIGANIDSGKEIVASPAHMARKLTANSYTIEQANAMERDVIATLDLDFDRPSAFTFFDLFTQTADPDTCARSKKDQQEKRMQQITSAARRLLASVLTFSRTTQWRGSQLAYAALFLEGFDSQCMKNIASRYPKLYNANVAKKIDDLPVSNKFESKSVDALVSFSIKSAV